MAIIKSELVFYGTTQPPIINPCLEDKVINLNDLGEGTYTLTLKFENIDGTETILDTTADEEE